jgi:hypothetical protein
MFCMWKNFQMFFIEETNSNASSAGTCFWGKKIEIIIISNVIFSQKKMVSLDLFRHVHATLLYCY